MQELLDRPAIWEKQMLFDKWGGGGELFGQNQAFILFTERQKDEVTCGQRGLLIAGRGLSLGWQTDRACARHKVRRPRTSCTKAQTIHKNKSARKDAVSKT